MVCPAKDLIALPGDADLQQLAMISINPPTAYRRNAQLGSLTRCRGTAIPPANRRLKAAANKEAP